MTVPEQVLVNVADLRIVLGDEHEVEYGRSAHAARARLRAAIPEPEWEPTDDMIAKYRRAHQWNDPDDLYADDGANGYLRAMHREGLL